MKRILLFYIFLISVEVLFCQERKSIPKMQFEKSSQILNYALGWCFDSDDTGGWISYVNAICIVKHPKVKQPFLLSPKEMSFVGSSFNSLQMKTFQFGDSTYYILLVDRWTGAFEYPAIGEGWSYYKVVKGYLFNENEYKKLLNIKGKVVLKAFGTCDQSEASGHSNILVALRVVMNTGISMYSGNGDGNIFPILKTNEGKIRFYLPDFEASYNKMDFEKEYYETTMANFSKLLIQ